MAHNEIVALPSTAHLNAIADPVEQAKYITYSCEQANVWLSHALSGNRIESVMEIKAQAGAISEYTTQKRLAKEAQLAAGKILRRAEYGLALLIRKGQEDGTIQKRGRPPGKNLSYDKISHPLDFASHSELYGGGNPDSDHPGILHLVDGVTSEQFEAGLAEATAEGNLSRANVVRKLKKRTTKKADRWADFAELVSEGHTSDQIASKIGVGRTAVAKKAKALGLVIHADRVVSKTRRLDPNRILREFVGTLESLVPSCEMIDPSKTDPALLAESIEALTEALRAFNRLKKRLQWGQ